MSQKKILILGGSAFQIPLIKKAKEMGLYVITCDYLPDNPGHAFSDEYHNVSTTDRESVYSLALKLKIDAITSFSSDPAVMTMAYVSQRLGIPGPTESSIVCLTEKDMFRETMQRANLKVPCFQKINKDQLIDNIDFTKRYIVKPVDSSGSKGIRLSNGTKQGLNDCINYALDFSRAKRCIVEEYIDGTQVHGDGFLINGKLIHHYIGDHFFYTNTNSFIPTSTRWPSKFPEKIINEVVGQVEMIAQESGYHNGAVNIEARINANNQVFIIEVGPRNGGNFVPIIQNKLTGFNFVDAALNLALGNPVVCEEQRNTQGVGGYYILHSKKSGFFSGVEIKQSVKKHIYFKEIFKKKGDPVMEYSGSNTTLGVCLLTFDTLSERDEFYTNIDENIKVVLE